MPHQNFELLNSRSHPQRQALTDEMQVRNFPAFGAPARIFQLVVLSGDGQLEAAREQAMAICRHFGATVREPGKYLTVRMPGLHFMWEQHSEFTTYSFIRCGAPEEPFASPLLSELPTEWLVELPGPVVRATQIELLSKHSADPSTEDLARWFGLGDLVCCDVLDGEARIWSNFRLHPEGLGRLLVRDQSLVGDSEPSRLIQRLQELGNYRNMALMGLPVAQRLTPTLSQLERRLANVSGEISRGASHDEVLMQKLSFLSAELAGLTAETSYRMSASRAYAQVVRDRLHDLRIVRVPGHQTLLDFIERRFTPAMRTCESFWERSGELSERAAWASSLMRMRIETALERQNSELLASMNQRAHLQLRLQETVEGLSVIAISYYIVGILGYTLKAFAHAVPAIDSNVAVGSAAPLVVVGVWLLIRRLRCKLKATSDER